MSDRTRETLLFLVGLGYILFHSACVAAPYFIIVTWTDHSAEAGLFASVMTLALFQAQDRLDQILGKDKR